MQNGHIDPTFLHICVNTKLTAVYTLNTNAKYIVGTNVCPQIWAYMPHMPISNRFIWNVYTYMCHT